MYPRIREHGFVYFITSNIQNRLNLFTRPSFIIPILDSLNFYRYQHDCRIYGYVIMPDHIHLLLRPNGQPSTVSDFMRDFKRFTSGRISRQADLEGIEDWTSAFRTSGRNVRVLEKQVWQASFWEQVIFSGKFMRQKLNYIHLNPVRAGLVQDASEYPYSSYRNYLVNDFTMLEIDKDWTGG